MAFWVPLARTTGEIARAAAGEASYLCDLHDGGAMNPQELLGIELGGERRDVLVYVLRRVSEVGNDINLPPPRQERRRRSASVVRPRRSRYRYFTVVGRRSRRSFVSTILAWSLAKCLFDASAKSLRSARRRDFEAFEADRLDRIVDGLLLEGFYGMLLRGRNEDKDGLARRGPATAGPSSGLRRMVISASTMAMSWLDPSASASTSPPLVTFADH